MAEQTQGILGEFIRAQRQFADLSLRQLADLSKVSNAYLSQVERGLYTPSAHVLKSIAEALDLSAETLYARAGLLDDAPEGGERPVSVEEAIRLDERFTAEQKDSLLRLCAIFRGAG